MATVVCPNCGKAFKGERGLGWHLAHSHANVCLPQSAPARVVPCSEAAMKIITKVAEQTGLATQEVVDLVVAAAIENDPPWAGAIDAWDSTKSGDENAPWWLPLRKTDY